MIININLKVLFLITRIKENSYEMKSGNGIQKAEHTSTYFNLKPKTTVTS